MYVARVLGRPAEREFTVSCAIRPEPRIRPYQVVDAAKGKDSVTNCKVIEEDSDLGKQYAKLFPASLAILPRLEDEAGAEGGAAGALVTSTLVELRPRTGR